MKVKKAPSEWRGSWADPRPGTRVILKHRSSRVTRYSRIILDFETLV